MTDTTTTVNLSSLLGALIGRRIFSDTKSTLKTANDVFETILTEATTFCNADTSSISHIHWRFRAIQERLSQLPTCKNKPHFRITLSYIINQILLQFASCHFYPLDELPIHDPIISAAKDSLGYQSSPAFQPDIVITPANSLKQHNYMNFDLEDWTVYEEGEVALTHARHELEWKDVLCSILVEIDTKAWDTPLNQSTASTRNTLKLAKHHFRNHWNLTHSLVLQFKGPNLVLLYHDAQGTIQTKPIHIVHHLPLLVSMFVVLQHFNPMIWGTPNISLSADFDGVPHTFCPNNARARNEDGTYMAPVEWIEDKSGGGSRESRTLPDAFFKAHWPEVCRVKEPVIIEEARSRAKNLLPKNLKPYVLNHIPTVVIWGDVPETSTALIRQILGLPEKVLEGSRSLVWMVSEKLELMNDLEPPAFFLAFMETIGCHILLWKIGIAHGDISLTNLMVNPTTKRGVLNDFDLAAIMNPGGDSPQPHGFQRTGTLPFMAIEMLRHTDGTVYKRYCHDLESFAWCLFWHCADFPPEYMSEKCQTLTAALEFKRNLLAERNIDVVSTPKTVWKNKQWNFLASWMKLWAKEIEIPETTTRFQPDIKAPTQRHRLNKKVKRVTHVDNRTIDSDITPVVKNDVYYLKKMIEAGMASQMDPGWLEMIEEWIEFTSILQL